LTNGGRLSVGINPTITISFIRSEATTAVMITSASPPFLSLLRLQKEVGPIAIPLKPVADVAVPGSDERRTTAEIPEGGKAPAEKVKAVEIFERKADWNQQNKREDPKKAGKEADNEP
jgi:hypothetical protein